MNIVLIGDAWVAGHRDQIGLGVPLAAKLGNRTSPPAAVRDFTEPGGLGKALRQVATGTNAFGDDPKFVVCLGIEDAKLNPSPEEWIGGYLNLVQQLIPRGLVLLVVPPALDVMGAHVNGYGRKARRWTMRVPMEAALRACDACPGKVIRLEVPESIERADAVWLRPAGVRRLAGLICDRLLR